MVTLEHKGRKVRLIKNFGKHQAKHFILEDITAGEAYLLWINENFSLKERTLFRKVEDLECIESRFEAFKRKAKCDHENYVKELSSNGSFSYVTMFESLITLSNRLSYNMLKYLFDEQLAKHYMDFLSLPANVTFSNF